MALNTYLDLVNEVILESRVDLDLLDATTFATPPRTRIYNDMKRWTNRSYQEILLKREEWRFRAERTVINLLPRIRLRGLVAPLATGDVLVGRASGVGFVVVAAYVDVTDPDGDMQIDVTYDFEDDNVLMPGELLDRTAPTAQAGIGVVQGAGTYSLRTLVPTLETPDITGIYIQEVPSLTDPIEQPAAQLLHTVDDSSWAAYTLREWERAGTPQYVTLADNGEIAFFPRLDRPYSFVLPYSRKVAELTNWNDSPMPIPENLRHAIVWRAVMKYANADNKNKIFMTARDEYRFYNNLLESKHLPPLEMPKNRFWGG